MKTINLIFILSCLLLSAESYAQADSVPVKTCGIKNLISKRSPADYSKIFKPACNWAAWVWKMRSDSVLIARTVQMRTVPECIDPKKKNISSGLTCYFFTREPVEYPHSKSKPEPELFIDQWSQERGGAFNFNHGLIQSCFPAPLRPSETAVYIDCVRLMQPLANF